MMTGRVYFGSKDKDKEALFNVVYNVTDNISLRHNNYIFNRYLPVFISLAQPFYASVSKGAASTIFYTLGMVRPRDSNPRPPAPKADALPTELSRRFNSDSGDTHFVFCFSV